MVTVRPQAELSSEVAGISRFKGLLNCAEGICVPSNRRSGAPSELEWKDPYLPVKRKVSRRSSIGSTLAAPLTTLLALFLIPLSGSIYYAMTTPDQYTG